MELEADIFRLFYSDAETSKNDILARNFENRYPTHVISEDSRMEISGWYLSKCKSTGMKWVGYLFSKLREKSVFLNASDLKLSKDDFLTPKALEEMFFLRGDYEEKLIIMDFFKYNYCKYFLKTQLNQPL